MAARDAVGHERERDLALAGAVGLRDRVVHREAEHRRDAGEQVLLDRVEDLVRRRADRVEPVEALRLVGLPERVARTRAARRRTSSCRTASTSPAARRTSPARPSRCAARRRCRRSGRAGCASPCRRTAASRRGACRTRAARSTRRCRPTHWPCTNRCRAGLRSASTIAGDRPCSPRRRRGSWRRRAASRGSRRPSRARRCSRAGRAGRDSSPSRTELRDRPVPLLRGRWWRRSRRAALAGWWPPWQLP